MAIRPGQIRFLTKGKAIGAKSLAGFVDTFNWMLSWIYNFKVGPGLRIEGERAGTPRVSLTLMNDDGAPIDDGGEDTPYEMTGEGGGEVTLRGADDSNVSGNDFTFESAADSNVVATMVEDEDTGVKKVVIGVYYV